MKLIGVELHQALAEADRGNRRRSGTAHVLEQGSLLVVLRPRNEM